MQPISAEDVKFTSFAWQLSVLGYGGSSLAYKMRNLLHSMYMKTSSEEGLQLYRESVIGYTTDQGTERKLCDASFSHTPTLRELSQFSSDVINGLQEIQDGNRYFLFPNALCMLGHQHIIFNSLQSAVEKSKLWGARFVGGLRGLISFLGNKGLRARFQFTCIQGKGEFAWHFLAFDSWSSAHLDWRWETLGQLLDVLNPLMPLVLKYWDYQKIRYGSNETMGEIDVACAKVTNNFLQIPWLLAALETLRVLAVMCNQWSSWLEGCMCHEHIWRQGGISYEQRLQLFQQETGMKGCVFKGCRGCEMASGSGDRWLASLCGACSSELSKQLHGLDVQRRACLLAVEQDLLDNIMEELGSKFVFWQHMPHLLLGLFHPDLAIAKEIGHRCLAEWESQPSKALFHRVVHRFFKGIVFEQLKQFCADPSSPLRAYPALHNMVYVYNTVSLVERSIEAEHAKITEVF